MPEPIANWNETRDCWESAQSDLFSGLSDVFWETWPHSGTTRAGTAYERPTSAPLTDGSGCSLLPTPRSTRGGSNTETVYLLQTPSVADAMGGHLSRGGARSGELLLNGQVKALAFSQPPEPATAPRVDPTSGVRLGT